MTKTLVSSDKNVPLSVATCLNIFMGLVLAHFQKILAFLNWNSFFKSNAELLKKQASANGKSVQDLKGKKKSLKDKVI